MGIVLELARAKVNLTLRLRGRRSDGYHELESLVVFADIGDVIELTPAGAPTVTTRGAFATAIAGENLVGRALGLLAQARPGLQLGAITIEKKLPVAAGLGGGSADAAAALRAIRRANPTVSDQFDWHGLAATLGADVPVCLENAPSLMWGVGEKVRPLSGLPPLDAVLVNPLAAVPPDKTREVFRRLAAASAPAGTAEPAPLPQFAGPGNLITYLEGEANDLEAAASDLMPACREVRAALAACSGCRLVRMSGAGPTSFGLFDDREAAHAAARALAVSHPAWWVRAVVLG